MPTEMGSVFERVESLMASWSLEEATQLLERARAAGEFPNRLHHDLSVLYSQQGFFAEALHEIEAAMAGDPSNRAVWHHFLALQKNNPVQPSPAEWRAMHLAFGDTLAARNDRRYAGAPRARSPGEKLRVGYLCPDTHLATERFMWPVLEHFDAGAFEVFAYWCHAPDTRNAEREHPRAKHRTIRGLDDEAVANLLVADGIDIAVDVAGHGSGNVLPAFALRPAPVRITWLDYLATVGLEAMDFRITDEVADPAGIAEAAHLERLIRLPVPQWCYRPHPEAPSGETAAPRSGEGMVFGSACVPLKLSDPLLDLWARLLLRVPQGRLRMLGIPEGRACSRIVERFARGGVSPDRLEIMGRLSQRDFLAALSSIDVVLDSHPFSGATSTLDALWQGVPVVTLAGPLSHGRSTTSLLSALGRAEWVADSPERFLEIAASLVKDPARLSHERASLRRDLLASPLCDGPGFARAMDGALSGAWTSVAGRNEVSPREETAAFWRGLRGDGVAGNRSAVRGLAGWTCLTSERHYDLGAVALEVPAELLAGFDVLGSLGASAMVGGDITAAGRGRVRGVTLIGDGDRFYCNAFVPNADARCAALAGPVLLVRSEWLAGLDLPRDVPSEPAFRAALTRLSHELHLKGARLGVSVALAAPERSPLIEERADYAAKRDLERALGLPRWSQRAPGAIPFKAVIPRAAWPGMLAALERVCDTPIPWN